MFHVFGPSRSPPCFFSCFLGNPWAVRFRLMFHTLGLLGQFVLHAICMRDKRCTSSFRIQYYTFATFCSVRGLTLCLLFAVASNGEVSFSMTVSRFRRVEHRMRRFIFFCKFLGKNLLQQLGLRRHLATILGPCCHLRAPVGTLWLPLGSPGLPFGGGFGNNFTLLAFPNPPKSFQTLPNSCFR